MTSAADITILVRGTEGRLVLELSTIKGGTTPPVPLELTPAKLKELRENFAAGLRDFVGILATNGRVLKDPQIADAAMRCLYRVGAELGFAIFGGTAGRDVENFLRTAWPSWAKAADDDYVPPRVELVGSLDFPLPLEFVPLFNNDEVPAKADALSIATRFPAFSTIFFRSPSDRTPQTSTEVIDNRSALLIRLFLHAGLPGAKDEATFLRSAPGTTLRGPWPDRALPAPEFLELLAHQMLYATAPGTAGSLDRADHIQHYVCHCDTDKALSRDYTIQLAHAAKKWGPFASDPSRTVSLADLGAKFYGRRTSRPGPLVFLNACGSSKVTPEGVSSFPALFLHIGSRGVIGTETAIPDLAAAEFAREFYTIFLKGFTLGEALFEARLRLLRNCCNPIGALYSAYANADLRVHDPIGVSPVAPRHLGQLPQRRQAVAP